MKTQTLLLICILSAILCTPAIGKIIYVDDDANGVKNGTSWENAYKYLQDALTNANNATKPVEIRVAQGIYKPDLGTGISRGSRQATFQMINKVSLAGGYAGLGQPDPNNRDVELYETILSGDLQSNDAEITNTRIMLYEPSRADNCYRVITGSNIDSTTSINGFTITAGNANGTSSSSQNSGGIYTSYCDLTISNCTFTENSARQGGGVYNNYGNLKFINCSFSENMAEVNGGGMYNYHGAQTLTGCIFSGNITGQDGSGLYNSYANSILTNCTFNWNVAESEGGGIYNYYSNPVITDCLFNLNLAAYDGGGIFNYYSNSTISDCLFTWNVSVSDGGGISNYQSNPQCVDCIFSENIADYNGGGMFNYNKSNPTITNCFFYKNNADSGGGIYNYSNSNPTLISCTFNGNSAYYGGGIYIYNSSPTFTNCTFSENIADYYGGGMYNYYKSNPTLTNCTFSDNIATGDYGGGIYNYTNSNATLTNCTFKGNIAYYGGGMANRSTSNPALADCTFIENKASTSGAGMYNNGSNPTLTDCIFSENASMDDGGGMYNISSSNPALTNCKFSRNDAKYDGGGIYNAPSCNPSIEKCLFRENTSGNYGGGMYNDNSKAKVMNCIFSGNRAVYKGGGIYNTKDSNINVDNCIFTGNLSPNGNAVSCYSTPSVSPSVVKLTNCILWDENKQIWNSGPSTITISYCDVRGGQSTVYDPGGKISFGAGNFDCDPCFAVAGYWDTNSTPANTNDDFWIDGDYHLKSQAGRFDPNSQSWIIDSVTSLCIDAGDPNSPINYELVPHGGIINIGAYGGTIEASKSLHDVNYFNLVSYPYPADGAVNVILDTMLNWISDINAVAHEIYLGTGEYPPFVNKHYETQFEPEALEPNTLYHWRIDEVDNFMNRVTGNIWSFTTGLHSAHLTKPYPANGAINVAINALLSWFPGSNADTYNVYFGTDFNDVNEATIANPLGVLVSAGQEPNYYNPGTLAYDKLYFWRVDETDSNEIVTKGDVWTFITVDPGTKGRACFTGQTPVWIDGKTVTIAKACAGQSINTIDKIEQVQVHEGTFTLYDIFLDSGDCITVADEHYFMAESGRWISSKKLEAGMILRTAKGLIKIKSISKQSQPFTGKVYNLKIKSSDKYMVGKDAVIVRDY